MDPFSCDMSSNAPNKFTNLDDAVAPGSTLQAAILIGDRSSQVWAHLLSTSLRFLWTLRLLVVSYENLSSGTLVSTCLQGVF